MIKEIYVFVDKDGDIVEYYPSNSVIDDVYRYKEYRERLNGPLKVHSATIQIGEEVKDRVHKTSGKFKAAKTVKVNKKSS